jgi:hypothetical protein
MPEYIKTKADLLRGLAHLADDEPIEFFLNNVATKASFGPPGVEGGDTYINVEPNYTCKPAASARVD